jgi:hypothetical protein
MLVELKKRRRRMAAGMEMPGGADDLRNAERTCRGKARGEERVDLAISERTTGRMAMERYPSQRKVILEKNSYGSTILEKPVLNVKPFPLPSGDVSSGSDSVERRRRGSIYFITQTAHQSTGTALPYHN